MTYRIRVILPRSLLLLSLLLSALPLRAEVINISSDELASLVSRGVPVVDIRVAREWRETGVVPGSRKLTFFDDRGGYDAGAWLASLDRVADRNNPVILICQIGTRSRVIANWLSEGMGYKKVYNVTRGIDDWIRRGHPTAGG